MNVVSAKLLGLSSASLLVWRQVLNQPMKMPFWEAKSEPVQALVKAGLISLEFEGVGTYAIYTADLQKDFLRYRFTADQKLFLAKLTEGPLPIEQYIPWARAHNIDDPLTLVRALHEIFVIKYKIEPGKILFMFR